jgi:hypothetical protein
MDTTRQHRSFIYVRRTGGGAESGTLDLLTGATAPRNRGINAEPFYHGQNNLRSVFDAPLPFQNQPGNRECFLCVIGHAGIQQYLLDVCCSVECR